MGVDKNEFFHRMTMQICSSLDIEVALWRSLQVIKDFIPADEMYLHLYESGLGAMRTIAGATAAGGRKMDRITPLPTEVLPRVSEFTGLSVLNQPEAEPGFEFMLKYYGRPDTSALVQLLETRGSKNRGPCYSG